MTEKILVVGNYKDAMYHPFGGVDERLKEIFPEKELVCTDDVQELAALRRGEYTGVISYLDIWDGALTGAQAEALRFFVEEGGALLILHNGISIQSREELKVMMGAKFLTHPPMEEITFKVKEHEITADCTEFTLPEEPYQFEFVPDDKEIILVYIYHGEEYTAGWSKCVGKGRLVFLTPGHTAEIFDNPEYRALIQNSMEWCLQ
ncbi:MAG: ThuA domain-containing protein [Lachnospiraceae bacterium]|nr:ThuA domain-containing protein [Lachnospiraceae bacterium]